MKRILTAVVIIFCLSPLAAPLSQAAADVNGPVTSYAQMLNRITTDAKQTSWIRVRPIGVTASGRRRIWVARIGDPSATSERSLRLVVLCRQHGDEPASTEAVLNLLQTIAGTNEAKLRAQLSGEVVYFLPMVNPDGADALTRRNAEGADLNRDWGVFSQPETRSVSRFIGAVRPQILVDAHNWDEGDPYNADCIEVSRDLMSPLGQQIHSVQQSTAHDLAKAGLPVYCTGYGIDADPCLAHRYFARRGTVAMLVETHAGAAADRADFLRRQKVYTALIWSLIRRYSGNETQRRLLDTAEPAWASASQEEAFFPASAESRKQLEGLKPADNPYWLMGLAGCLIALWMAARARARLGPNLPEDLALCIDNGTGRRRWIVQASETRSSSLLDKLLCLR